jgi:hypothetical protein
MSKRKSTVRTSNFSVLKWLGIGLAVLGLIYYFTFRESPGTAGTVSSDLTILKKNITSTATFFPISAGDIKMEVLALKAPDGSIRTAFNTCQVCFNSGRGYYIQEGDELVCQNCGNRFRTSEVEKIKGGCNPVPILESDKTDNGSNIVISAEFLQQNEQLFTQWGKQ